MLSTKHALDGQIINKSNKDPGFKKIQDNQKIKIQLLGVKRV